MGEIPELLIPSGREIVFARKFGDPTDIRQNLLVGHRYTRDMLKVKFLFAHRSQRALYFRAHYGFGVVNATSNSATGTGAWRGRIREMLFSPDQFVQDFASPLRLRLRARFQVDVFLIQPFTRHSGAPQGGEPGTQERRLTKLRAGAPARLVLFRGHGFRVRPCGPSRNDPKEPAPVV